MGSPEGATPLYPDEMEGLKFKHVATRKELDHLEQANIQSGIAWMRKSKRTDLFSESYVRELHRRLFGEVWSWAGTFRRSGKNIGIDPLQISTALRALLEDTHYWFEHKIYSPQEAALRFHHRLVFIHPFPNGNGRHARIMADALLIKIYRHPPIDWTGGHNLGSMNERRREYIQALQAADRGDFKLLLTFGETGNRTN